MLNIKEELASLRVQIEEAKSSLLVIRMTPVESREKNFSSVVRRCRRSIAVAKRRINQLLFRCEEGV